jgi:3-oxoacyl-[acyl-carrier protein] reductase
MGRRLALITGASSGIGAATAVEMAEEGCSLWLTYASSAAATEAVAERCRAAGAEVHLAGLDVRRPEQVGLLLDEVTRDWGHLHALVNNGGICPYTRHDEIGVEEWDAVLETNARGVFLMIERALPLLRAADGDRSIVNISSVAGEVGGMTTSVHYAASKAAILAITRSYARLLAVEGIRVNAVAPGPIESEITSQLSPEARRSLAGSAPLGRFGDPEEVAPTIALLASERSSFTTGATYDVNGGVRIG